MKRQSKLDYYSDDSDDFNIIYNNNFDSSDSSDTDSISINAFDRTKSKNKGKFQNRTRNSKNKLVSDKNINFVSGGVLNLDSQADENDFVTGDFQDLSDMELNSENEFESPFKNKLMNQDEPSEVLQDDQGLLKLYGKGLKMIKKMGYKGGNLGKHPRPEKVDKTFQDTPDSDPGPLKSEEKSIFSYYSILSEKNNSIKDHIKNMLETNKGINLEINLITKQINDKENLLQQLNYNKTSIVNNYNLLLNILTNVNSTFGDNEKLVQLINEIVKSMVIINDKNVERRFFKRLFRLLFKKKGDKLEVEEVIKNINVVKGLKVSSSYLKKTIKSLLNYFIVNDIIKYNINIGNIDVYIQLFEGLYDVEHVLDISAINRVMVFKLCKIIKTNLTNCHLVIFPFLQYLELEHIDSIVNKFILQWVKLLDGLDLKEDPMEEAESLYKNWEKLVENNDMLGRKVQDLLSKKLTRYVHNNGSDVSGFRGKEMKNLVDNVLKFKMIDKSDLLESTLIRNFSNNLLKDMNSVQSYEGMTNLVNKYVNFKTLLPDFINNSPSIQNNYYKPILHQIELYINKFTKELQKYKSEEVGEG